MSTALLLGYLLGRHGAGVYRAPDLLWAQGFKNSWRMYLVEGRGRITACVPHNDCKVAFVNICNILGARNIRIGDELTFRPARMIEL